MKAQPKLLNWPSIAQDAAPLALWDAIALARAVKGTANADFAVSGVEIDSRDVQPGDLFFALKGEATDGHRFIAMALEKGASAGVVDRDEDAADIRGSDNNTARTS